MSRLKRPEEIWITVRCPHDTHHSVGWDAESLITNVGEIEARYYDIVTFRYSGKESAVRGGEMEEHRWSSEALAARVLSKGYGVASIDRIGPAEARSVIERAAKLAEMSSTSSLAPAEIEKGSREMRADVNLEALAGLANELYEAAKGRLSTMAEHIESVVDMESREKTIASSEGSSIIERIDSLTAIIYALGPAGTVRAAISFGGSCPQRIDVEEAIDRLVEIASYQRNFRQLSPFYDGHRFKVVLDWECSGALAHEVAHALEATSYRYGLVKVSQRSFVDHPGLPGGYGLQFWDDEAVRAPKKRILSPGGKELLHTRATAQSGGKPGNARGLSYKPRPLMSNVYMEPEDWDESEIVEDTSRGMMFIGLEEARLDTSTGVIVMKPQVAVYFERKGEVMIPIADAVLVDRLSEILAVADAASRRVRMRPNMERGYPVSEGGPTSRLSGARIEKRSI